MDGLELQGLVVEVDQLRQGVPGGQGLPLILGRDALLPLIALLGGGQGVVPVSHSEQEDRLVLGPVAGVEGGGISQSLEGAGHGGELLPPQLPTGQVAAPLHQIEVIDLLHARLLPGQGLDDGALRIVSEEHDVRQLNGGVLPHRHSGRDTGEDGALGGPHLGRGARLIVVLLQVHHAHQSSAELSVVQAALYIDHGLGQKGKPLLPQIAGHGVVDLHDRPDSSPAG